MNNELAKVLFCRTVEAWVCDPGEVRSLLALVPGAMLSGKYSVGES